QGVINTPPSPPWGEGSGVRGSLLPWGDSEPLTPNPSPQGGEGGPEPRVFCWCDRSPLRIMSEYGRGHSRRGRGDGVCFVVGGPHLRGRAQLAVAAAGVRRGRPAVPGRQLAAARRGGPAHRPAGGGVLRRVVDPRQARP